MNENIEKKIRGAAATANEAGVNMWLRPVEIEALLGEIDNLRRRNSELEGRLGQLLDEHELETRCPVCGADLSMAV